MLHSLKHFLTRGYTLFIVSLFIFAFSVLKVSAIYYPTDNITNPTCAPGAVGCYVSLLPDQTSKSGSLLFTNGTNPSWSSPSALSWDSVNGRLGVGTSSPANKLSIFAPYKFNSTHKIYSIGDSLTANGIYGNRIISLLGSSWYENNKGVPGNTTNQMLSRFNSDVVSYSDAEYVIIWGGVNDAAGSVAVETIKENLQTMYDAAHNNGIKVVAATITPWKGSSYWTAEKQNIIESVNTWILNDARNVDYRVDLYSLFVDSLNPGTLLSIYDSGDHIHLNTNGYEMVGTTIYNAVTWNPSFGNAIDVNGDSYFSGKIGIGTNNPSARLQVVGGVNIDGGLSIGEYSGRFTSPAGGIITSGNVGIGNNSPTYKLVVGGGAGSSNFGTPTIFAPEIQSTSTSGQAGIGVVVNDGVFNKKTSLFVDNLTGLSGISSSSTSGSTPFVFRNGGIEIMRLIDTGRVGIGSTSPLSILELKSSTPILSINATDYTVHHGIEFLNSGFLDSSIKQKSQFGEFQFNVGRNSSWGGFMTFYTDTTEKMRLTSLGNLGIGNNSPTYKLVVGGGAGSSNFGTPTIFAPEIQSTSTSGQAGIGVVVNDGSFNRRISMFVDSSTSTYGISSTVGSGSTPFVFRNGGIEIMRLIDTGRVGVSQASPLYTLHVGSSSVTGIVSRFQNSTGTCDINPTTTSLSCSSDINLKKNITTLKDNQPFVLNTQTPETSILKNLNKITPVIYNWTTEQDIDTKHPGFIAQDVEQIFPSLVSTDPTTNLKSLNYIGLIPYAIEGIRELDIKVNQQASLDTEIAGSFGYLAKEFLNTVNTYIKDLTVGKLKIDGDVCVDDVCISKEQFKQMLIDQQNKTGQVNNVVQENNPEIIPENQNNEEEPLPDNQEIPVPPIE